MDASRFSSQQIALLPAMYQRRLLAQTTRLSRLIPQRTLLVRCYAQDVVRDPMTGELSTLPDIDVCSNVFCRIHVWLTVHESLHD